MIEKIIVYSLQRAGIWKMTMATVIFSMIFSSMITAIILMLFNQAGRIPYGVLNASICAVVIATPVSYCFFRFMGKLNTSRNELETKNAELNAALHDVKELSGLLPICASCKKIKDSKGYWNHLEQYIESHSDVLFSHGICEECAERMYGENDWYKKRVKNEFSKND